MLTEAERASLTKAVARAESMTNAEFVPVIARDSGRYDRAEDIAGLWGAMIVTAAMLWFWPAESTEHGSWGPDPRYLVIGRILAGMVLGFLVGVLLSHRITSLRRLFVPRREIDEEVARAARMVFFDQRIHHAPGRAGLLIYVSVFEHKAFLLADERLLAACGQAQLDEWCQRLTSQLKTTSIANAISSLLEHASSQLAATLPRSSDDCNELSDAVIVI
jgi:putative membrane protein